MTTMVNTKKWVVIVATLSVAGAFAGCSDDDDNPPCVGSSCVTADAGMLDQKVQKDGEVPDQKVIVPPADCPPKDMAYKCMPMGKTDKADIQDWVSLGEKSPLGNGECHLQRLSDQGKNWFQYDKITKVATDPVVMKLTCNPAQ